MCRKYSAHGRLDFCPDYLEWWAYSRTKKALYQAIAERLNEKLDVRKEDVFISLVEVTKENWSYGNGMAQYA